MRISALGHKKKQVFVHTGRFLLFLQSIFYGQTNIEAASAPPQAQAQAQAQSSQEVAAPLEAGHSGMAVPKIFRNMPFPEEILGRPQEEPNHPQYLSLCALLKHYEECQRMGETKLPHVPIPMNQHHPHVALLAKQLAQQGFLSKDLANRDIFDDTLRQGLQALQQAYGIEKTGVVDAKTLQCLNTPLSKLIQKVKKTLERWKNVTCGNATSVIINIPSFTLHIFKNGQQVLKAPVIVGMHAHKTPQIHSAIKKIIVHPSWFVPPRLAKKLWGCVGAKGYHSSGGQLVQSPGPRNALGAVKFVFDNPYSIVVHGTPEKHLFKRSMRACSNGCVRLEKPEKIAECLLEGSSDLLSSLNHAFKKKQSRTLNVGAPIPIHILYSTMWVDENGYPSFFKDVYSLEKNNPLPIPYRQEDPRRHHENDDDDDDDDNDND